jgi:hypothetical protein
MQRNAADGLFTKPSFLDGLAKIRHSVPGDSRVLAKDGENGKMGGKRKGSAGLLPFHRICG